MVILAQVRRWLAGPGVRCVDVDSVACSNARREVLRREPVLRSLFERFYHECALKDHRSFQDCPGARLEVKSGSGFVKEVSNAGVMLA